jgi:hypothetical protein
MSQRSIAISLLFGTLLGPVALRGIAKPAANEEETLHVGQPLARFSLLTPSTRLYVRYKVIGDQRATLDIWRREVSLEEREGKRLVHVFWRWDSVGDRKYSRVEDFWFESGTLRPLTVERHLTRDGTVTASGYRYLTDRIVGLETMADNSQKDFVQLAALPAYNFETDMELLQTLPLAHHYVVQIPFYEAAPGQDAPRNYTYRVDGEAKIAAADGHKIDCWIVGTDSDNPNWGPTQFWFAKKSQVLIREQTRLKDGSIFVKSLLTNDVSDG